MSPLAIIFSLSSKKSLLTSSRLTSLCGTVKVSSSLFPLETVLSTAVPDQSKTGFDTKFPLESSCTKTNSPAIASGKLTLQKNSFKISLN